MNVIMSYPLEKVLHVKRDIYPKRFGKSCRKYICLVIDKSIICLKKELYRTKEGTDKSFFNLIALEKVNKICHVNLWESRQSFSLEN